MSLAQRGCNIEYRIEYFVQPNGNYSIRKLYMLPMYRVHPIYSLHSNQIARNDELTFFDMRLNFGPFSSTPVNCDCRVRFVAPLRISRKLRNSFFELRVVNRKPISSLVYSYHKHRKHRNPAAPSCN